jgi:HD-like signal output (HDOD) protein
MSGIDAQWLEKFWNHASLVATAAGLIARKQYGIAADAAYTYALFHDAAIPLLRKRFDNYCEVMNSALQSKRLLIEAEEEYFPCNHPIVGSLLVRNWGLPAMIAQSIRFHHEIDLYQISEKTLPGPSLSLIAVTQIAERLIADADSRANLEVSDAHFESALDHLGIAFDELDEIRELLAEDSVRA